MEMVRTVGRKVLYLIPVLFAVTVLSFLLLQLLPGNPAIDILGGSATPKAVKQLDHQLGLDRPLVDQYLHYLDRAVLHADLGYSYQNHQTTLSALHQRLPVTLELIILSQLIAFAIAVPVALMAATRPNGLVDRLTTSLSFGFLAVPDFILGVLLVFVFAVHYQLFPATGSVALTANPLENLKSMLLPSLTLALGSQAVYLRLLRADLIVTLQQDFIAMAKAKGLPSRYILLRHAFRPSSFSLVTVSGLEIGRLIGGTFIVEYLFALNGVGSLAVQSVYSRDYLVVQGTVLVIAVGYVLVNFAVDLLYTVLDPRIRHAGAIA
jgi:peptide/nickel transport system permease protein